MNKPQLIKRLKQVWKKQEELDKQQHKKINSMLRDFNRDDIKEILEDEELNLDLMEIDFKS